MWHRSTLGVTAIVLLLVGPVRGDDEADFKAEALKFIKEAKGLIKLFDDTDVTLGAFKEKRRKVVSRYTDIPDAPDKYELTGTVLKGSNAELASAEAMFELIVITQRSDKQTAALMVKHITADLAGTKKVLTILERVLKATDRTEALVFAKAKEDLAEAFKERAERNRSQKAELEKLAETRKAAREAEAKARIAAREKQKAEQAAADARARDEKAKQEAKQEAESKAAAAKKKADERARVEAAKERERQRIEKAKEAARVKEEERKAKEAKEAPIRAEKAAAAKLTLIKRLLDEDREKFKDKAVVRLEQLVKQYPKTKAAVKARALLKELEKQ